MNGIFFISLSSRRRDVQTTSKKSMEKNVMENDLSRNVAFKYRWTVTEEKYNFLILYRYKYFVENKHIFVIKSVVRYRHYPQNKNYNHNKVTYLILRRSWNIVPNLQHNQKREAKAVAREASCIRYKPWTFHESNEQAANTDGNAKV